MYMKYTSDNGQRTANIRTVNCHKVFELQKHRQQVESCEIWASRNRVICLAWYHVHERAAVFRQFCHQQRGWKYPG